MNYTHSLKSWVGLFEPILLGQKTHDLRVLDREYRIGDICRLREWDPIRACYTGRECFVAITYITSGSGQAGHNPCAFSPYALHPAMGVLSIDLLLDGQEETYSEQYSKEQANDQHP